jgi:DNA-binding NarL/FixJ family response regulator
VETGHQARLETPQLDSSKPLHLCDVPGEGLFYPMANEDIVMRILLADDQMKVRSALLLLLAQIDGLQIVGEAADATSVLQTVVQKQPDLVLLDWELPGLPLEQLLRLLWYERPSLKIIAMSSRPEAERSALATGVHAFFSKGEPPDQVLAIVQSLLGKGSDENEANIVT